MDCFYTVALRRGAGRALQWHAGSGRWWWADDAQTGGLHAWSSDDDGTLHCRLPDQLGALAECRSGALLLGLAKRLGLTHGFDTEGNGQRSVNLLPLAAVDAAEPRTGIKIGRTDRRGFFVFGTSNEAVDGRAIGSFYQYSRRYGLRRLALPAVSKAGSLCFSPDGARMYFADGAGGCIMRCDYDAESAGVARTAPFAQLAVGALAMASTVDGEGCLWNAQAGVNELVRYAPDGRVLRRIAIADGTPSCPAFGGAAFDRLMLLCAPDAAQRGGLLQIAAPGVTGLRETLFDDGD